MQTEATRSLAAAKAGMDEKTARRYVNAVYSQANSRHSTHGELGPTRLKPTGRTREKLNANPGLEAKTLFEDLQRRF